MSTSIGSTISFDTQLRNYLPNSIRDNSQLEAWIEEGDLRTKSELAADAIIKLIRILGFRKPRVILSMSGYYRIRRIIEEIRRFEGLLHYVHSRYSRKIYRDHLDHMLRTALISSYLASSINLLSEDDKEELVLAALFHDAGYPLQEAGNTLDVIGKSVRIYELLDFKTTIESIDSDTSKHVKELSTLTGISEKDLSSDLKIPRHATVGAVIFLDCCRKQVFKVDSAQRIASAICLHHSAHNSIIESYGDRNPLPFLLALGDELQDWGRPTSYPIGYRGGLSITLPKLKIKSTGNSTDFVFKYKGATFPCYDAIHSKYLNLKRIRNDGNLDIPKITLQFPLEKVSPPILLDTIGKRFFDTVKFEKKGTWTFSQELRRGDARVASIVGLTQERVRNIRTILRNLKRTDWNTKLKLSQYDKSGNFLVSMNEPTGMKFVFDINKTQIELKLIGKQSKMQSGAIIKLNDPGKTRIPPILRTVPVIINFLSYIVRNEDFFKRKRLNHKSPIFPWDYEDRLANVFWFKPL